MNIKIFFLSIILFFVFGFFNAQHHNSDLEKEKVLNKVMNQLIMSTGHMMPKEPEIKLINREYNVASYSSSNVIKVERKAYEICQSFGTDSLNAMAYLIAHELGHKINRDYNSLHTCSFYAKSSFQANDSASNSIKKAITDQRRIEVEAIADQDACLYTQVSGFNSTQIVPELLKRIYSNYNFGDGSSMKSYPNLKQRIEISNNALKGNIDLALLFNVANTIFLSGKYDYSIVVYEELIERFPSREMFTNLAICYSSKAMQLMNRDSLTLVYPFELDTKSRLERQEITRGSYSNNDENNQLIIHNLKKADNYYRKAIRVDEKYFRALLFKSLIKNLMDNIDDAKTYLNKSKKAIKTKNDTNLFNLSKVIMDFNLVSDTNKLIKKLKEIENPTARRNIEILLGEKISEKNFATLNFSKPVIIDPWFNYDSTINLSDFRFKYTVKDTYSQFRIEDFIITEVKDLNNYKVNRIKKNYNYQKIINAVGQPDKVVNSYEKTYLVYPSSNLILTLKNDKFISYYYYEII